MSSLRTVALSFVISSTFCAVANGQAFVNQVQGSGGNSAFVPQISSGSSAFVPQLSGSGGASVSQVPINARIVPPRPRVQQQRQVRTQNVRARRQLQVVGQPSRESPFPSVGNGTQAIIPPKPLAFPSVLQGAVRL